LQCSITSHKHSVSRILGILFIVISLSAIQSIVSAQPVLRSEKSFTITEQDTTIFLDYWVVRESLHVFYIENDSLQILSNEFWELNTSTGKLAISFSIWQPKADSVTLFARYERFPFNIRPVFSTRELVLFDKGESQENELTIDQIARRRVTRDDLFGSSNLQRSGSVSRGITVGTNQDATLQSGLRFELSGFITEDVEIIATLTDQSTPIQPDGSTQNLRELDRVFIQLRNQHGTLQLGDIDVNLRNSEFAQIGRRLQGIGVETDLGHIGSYSSSASVVRGRFRVQEFAGRNGVQGPYRLTGAEGEQFIIVLAGSERVYLNGVRVNRGEENDYIIDYSLGEIFFTSNRMITDVTRITVDFQYVTQQYNRTLITAEAENNTLINGRLSFGATVIRESDSRDLNTEFGLSEQEIEILRQAGNNPDNAIVPGEQRVGFIRDADFILYAKRDTLVAGQQFEIFKNLPGDSTGVWRVQFSRVGSGNGSYRRKNTTVNGIVYEWVGPGRGEYEPFRRIPAPQMHQMAALRSRFRATDHLEFFGEWAVSEFDRNRFSSIDNETNTDIGYLTGVRLRPIETIIGIVDFRLRHRYTGDNFEYFDRTREVEFERRWDITRGQQVREQITEADLGIAFTELTDLRLQSGFLSRSDVESYRHTLNFQTQEPGIPVTRYQAEFSQSSITLTDTRSNWFRNIADTRYSIPINNHILTPSFGFEAEDRKRRFGKSDSLLTGSFTFYDLSPGIGYRYGNSFQASTIFNFREDRRDANGNMLFEARTRGIEFRTQLTPNEQLRIRNTLIFRDKEFSDFFIQNNQSENNRSVLLRNESDFRTQNEFLEIALYYEGGTESRPLLQETFIEVGPEIGNFVWIDLNNDGVQQIEEFFPAQTPNEGTFILQLLPSDELFSVNSINTRLRTVVKPEMIFRNNTGGLPNILSNIEWTSVLEIREQNREASLTDILFFNFRSYQNSNNTIDGRIFWLQDFRLFRPYRNIDSRISIDGSKGMRRRSAGLEESRSSTIRIENSYRFLRRWSASLELNKGKNELISEQLLSRSYQIEFAGVKPSLRYDYTRSLQIGTGLSYNQRRDVLPQIPARLNAYTVFSDVNWFYRNKLQAFFRIEYRSNQLRGLSSPTGAFELTDGAGVGNTWMWSVQGTYRINEYLRASLNYDGRTVTDRPAIQTMRFSLNAIF